MRKINRWVPSLLLLLWSAESFTLWKTVNVLQSTILTINNNNNNNNNKSINYKRNHEKTEKSKINHGSSNHFHAFRKEQQQQLIQLVVRGSRYDENDHFNDELEQPRGIEEDDGDDCKDEDNDDDSNREDDVFDQNADDCSSYMASPLSQIPDEDLDRRHFYRDDEWLQSSTDEMLNLDMVPIGSLSLHDMEAIVGLMSAWSRKRSVDAALVVEQLLKRIVDDMRAQNEEVHANSRMYTIAMEAWAKSGAPGGAQRAQHIHDTMVEMWKQTGDPRIAPSIFSYNTVISAWSRSSDPSSIQQMGIAFDQVLQCSNVNSAAYMEGIKPNAFTFSTMMDVHARSDKSNGTKRALEIFQLMDKFGVKRNVHTLATLQNVYARSRSPDAAKKAMDILETMLERFEQGDVFAKPSIVNYNAVLNALSKLNTIESAKLADEMLRKMELPVSEGGYDVEPDRFSYSLAILACARCPDAVFGSTVAEANLLKMEKRAKEEAEKREMVSSAAPPEVRLDIECFNVVLTALSKSRKPNAVEKILDIIQRMETHANDGQEALRPNTRSWNAVLNALKRSSRKGSARKAEQILNTLLERNRNGIQNVKPDAFSFAAVLSAYHRANNLASTQRADSIVRRMETLYEAGELENPPDVYHYTIVCSAWARSGHRLAPQRSLQILSHMTDRHNKGYPSVKPNVRTFNAVLDCLSRGGQEDKAERLLYHMLSLVKKGDNDARPDSFSFNTVINCFTRSKKRGSGQRAEAILDRFLEYSEECPTTKPDSRSFTHIIHHYSKSDALDAPYRAEFTLLRMIGLFKDGRKELEPNTFAFTAVMDAYTSQKHPDAGECAERLLRQMCKFLNEEDVTEVEVNTGVMNCVFNAWASCGDENAGRRAEILLDDLERKYEAGNEHMRPNSRCYFLVLNAWAKSGCAHKAERSLAILRRMEEQYKNGVLSARPNAYCYALVINACAFTKAGPDAEARAFDVAVRTMHEISMSNVTSSLAYAWFFQGCGRLKVEEHLRMTELTRVFHECCEKGLVNEIVMNRLRGAADEELFDEIMAPAIALMTNGTIEENPFRKMRQITVAHIPKEWSRNCFKKREQSHERIIQKVRKFASDGASMNSLATSPGTSAAGSDDEQ